MLLAACCALPSTAVLSEPAPELAHPQQLATLTLRQAEQRTLASSPELAQLPYRLQMQAARIDAAEMRPAPELSMQTENILGSGRTRGFDAAETSLVLSQVLELGGQRQLRTAAARQAMDLQQLEQRVVQLDVLAEVGRRFIHVASDQQQLALTELATSLSQRTVAEVERRVRAARSPTVELNRARVALSRARVEQEHAEHELLTSRRKLAAMWGAHAADFGQVVVELFSLPEIADYDALVERLGSSPDFLRFATEYRQREAELSLAKSKSIAPLTMALGVRQLAASDDTAMVAGLSLPLFAGRAAAPAIAEARALRDGVDAAALAARIRAEATLFELVQELRHANTEAEVLRDEVLPQMESALEATEYAWQRGRYSYLEWTDAQRERIEVQRALIKAAANAHVLLVEIERLTGASTSGVTPLPSGMPQ